MLTARNDVSAVPLQGGYIAKRCPVVIQNDILVPQSRVAVPVEVRHRMDAGITFEAELLEAIGVREGGAGDWIVIPAGPPDLAKRLTVEALDAGVPCIENAFLPDDLEGRRKGRPDLLVWHDDGYLPIDIKWHKTLTAGDGQLRVSDPGRPSLADSYLLDETDLRPREDDALQLAHYRRMLQASGYASSSTMAGIIGTEGLVVWYDLDEPMWESSADGARKKRTAMERYDFEFGFRLDIAAVALAHRESSGVELLVEPMKSDECGSCVYREHCGPILEEGAGDTSLLARFGYAVWRRARDHGVVTRQDLADLHYPTARLVADGVELDVFVDLARQATGDTPLQTLRPRASKQLDVLARAGIVTVADLKSGVDPTTAALGRGIAQPILEARAAVAPEPVLRRPGAEVAVPRADIEVDVDLEDDADGVYMWGTLLTDRAASGAFEEGYRAFVEWTKGDRTDEYRLFADFFKWLRRQRRLAERRGLTFRVYVWSPAEATRISRILSEHVRNPGKKTEDILDPAVWIDLMRVFQQGWTTGGTSSLKPIASIAGYEYPVDEPGGGYSMVVRDLAVGTENPDQHRQWLLDYNRGDVEATKHIREWLDREGRSWPVVRTA